MRTLTTSVLLLSLPLVCLAACKPTAAPNTPPAPQAAATTPVILTTMYPTTYFTERLAGSVADVRCVVSPDDDPLHWQPDDASLAALQAADLIVFNGADVESWAATASLPLNRVVDSSAGFANELITYAATTHRHGPQGASHTHEGVDGHTWLDPVNAQRQAEEIHRALAERWPEHADTFRTNLTALTGDLKGLHERFLGLLPAIKTTNLVASHPAYNYLAKRYDFPIINFDLDPAGELDEQAHEEMARRMATLDDETARIMLWESEADPVMTLLIERTFNLPSIVFSPVEGHAPGDPDYLAAMHANLDRLEAALNAR